MKLEMGHVKQEMGHWTWVGEDGKLTCMMYECELVESDYLPSISFKKLQVLH